MDAHGCSLSAGMHWCAKQSKCLRPFSSGFASEAAFEAECNGAQGGHADDQGCYTEAGYQWCGALRRCVRPWEEGMHTKAATTAACEHGILPTAATTIRRFSSVNNQAVAAIGNDVDSRGCVLSAGMHWCAKQSKCVSLVAAGFSSEKDFEAACDGTFGGHGDDQGCFSQAGFQWCPAMHKCVRPWEELGGPDCGFFKALTVGADVDAHGCLISENSHWCEKQGRCTKPWVCTPLLTAQ